MSPCRKCSKFTVNSNGLLAVACASHHQCYWLCSVITQYPFPMRSVPSAKEQWPHRWCSNVAGSHSVDALMGARLDALFGRFAAFHFFIVRRLTLWPIFSFNVIRFKPKIISLSMQRPSTTSIHLSFEAHAQSHTQSSEHHVTINAEWNRFWIIFFPKMNWNRFGMHLFNFHIDAGTFHSDDIE